MKAVAILVALLSILSIGAIAVSARPIQDETSALSFGDIWTNCSKATDYLHIDSVVLNPNPPQKGKDLSFVFNGTLSKTITAGSAKITIKYGIITVFNKSEDICTLSSDFPCPFPAGPLALAQTVSIPSSIPSGTYSGSIVVTDQSGGEIACININFKLS